MTGMTSFLKLFPKSFIMGTFQFRCHSCHSCHRREQGQFRFKTNVIWDHRWGSYHTYPSLLPIRSVSARLVL